MEEQVILVDPLDREVGVQEKMSVHRTGALHRAFSICLFNRAGELLLQRRALSKYHSGGLWTNTCCSHPRPGERMEEAVRRRLGEEMGLECPLEPVGTVLYRAELSGGWIEHELDHVWVGLCEEDPTPPPSEVMEWQWMSLAEVEKELAAHPERYTAWFSQVLSVYARSLPVQPSLVLSVEK